MQRLLQRGFTRLRVHIRHARVQVDSPDRVAHDLVQLAHGSVILMVLPAADSATAPHIEEELGLPEVARLPRGAGELHERHLNLLMPIG